MLMSSLGFAADKVNLRQAVAARRRRMYRVCDRTDHS